MPTLTPAADGKTILAKANYNELMLSNPLHFLAHRFACFLAWGIRFVSVNKVRTDASQVNLIIKSRSTWNWIPVTMGNLVFRFRVPAIRVLPTAEWIEWESAIQIRLGNHFQRVGSGVRTEKLRGETLAELLQQNQYSERQKLAWVELACRELARLHQIRLELDDVLLSHADASVANVMIERTNCSAFEKDHDRQKQGAANSSAIWFDFDLRHDSGVSVFARRADDLRALIFTALVCCRWERMDVLLEELKQAYSNREVWAELSRKVSSGQLPFDVFHLAQLRRANKSTAHWEQIERMIDLLKSEG